MSFASGKPDHHHQEWASVEAGYWHNTKKTRDREDAKLAHDHDSRQDELDHNLIELYREKSRLLDAVKNIDATIEYRREEKQRVSREYEAKRAQLLAERQDHDRSQQGWFALTRDKNLPAKETALHRDPGENRENALPKDMSDNLLADRAVPPPAPASSWTTVNNTTLRRSSRVQDQRRDHGNLFGNVFHNPVEEVTLPPLRMTPSQLQTDRYPIPPTQAEAGAVLDPAKHSNERVIVKAKSDRHSLPPISSVKEESPPDSRRSSRGRKSLPSVGDSASQTNSPAPESTFMVDQEKEITRESLILKDNGHTIVEPPMFAGVPLERIHPGHPFWNPEWEPLEQTVQAALDKWKERLENLRHNPDSVRHTMFLANRQVNRGQAVLDFLKDGVFHPFQFVSREMMDKYYKTFINYDTVFRLVNVHEELKKFDLDVTPLQWLRQRMYEIAEKQGEKFSLSKTTHDLYHDEKLKYLREKHGFGNIGRPSGYKLGNKGQAKGTTTKIKPKKAAAEAPAEAENGRRTRRSIAQVEADDRVQRSTGAVDEYLEPVSPRLPKRQRLDTTRVKQEPSGMPASREYEVASNDLDYEGYTSRDSFSRGRIKHLDFRVLQIKASSLTTRMEDTQYWTYKPEENKFEHQILRDVQPHITWELYGQPDKFNCRLEQIREIRYASNSLKIIVATTNQQQGDILVIFKRERTKKRFLTFVNKKGIMLIKSSQVSLEDAWDAMASEMVSENKTQA